MKTKTKTKKAFIYTKGLLRELTKAVGEWKDHHVKLWSNRGKSRRLKRAIRLADARHEATNKRVYVLEDCFGNYHPVTAKEVDILKRRGLMSRKATVIDLLKECNYHTR